MITQVKHTTVQNKSISNWPATGKNGIVRSFVASRKKYLFIKRSFDIVFAFVVITSAISWLLPIIALLIKIDSRGPVFFLQKRIGRNGKFFTCIKFRTMVKNAEADERPAERNDDRITKTGKFLRRTNLDELPQFFNVLAGKMSVVGPRPHMPADCIRFSFVISSYHFRNLVRPGITGLAQVNGYHGPTADYNSIIVRYYWDAQYVRKAGVWLDLKIIFATIVHGMKNFYSVCFPLSPDKKKIQVTGV